MPSNRYLSLLVPSLVFASALYIHKRFVYPPLVVTDLGPISTLRLVCPRDVVTGRIDPEQRQAPTQMRLVDIHDNHRKGWMVGESLVGLERNV